MATAELSEEKIHPLLRTSDHLSLGFKLDPRAIFTRYLKPEMQSNNRTRKSINDVERAVRRFDEWWDFELAMAGGDYEIVKPVVALLRAEHLRRFRGWMQDQMVFTNSNCNTHVQKLGAVLRCAVRNEILTHAPTIKGLPTKKAAPKYTMVFDQVERLWKSAEYLGWPIRRRDKRRLPITPATVWRSCAILWLTYGFRTQELMPFDSSAKPLTWGHIKLDRETPNPEGRSECEWGWIEYTPPKQSWCKDGPLYLPLTVYARAALETLRPSDWRPEHPICNYTLSSTSLYETWDRWLDISGVRPKRAGAAYKIKHLRKTAASWLFEHAPEISEYVTGHAADRSGMTQVSSVHRDHYVNAEAAVVEALETMEYPACFNEILSCRLAA